jgi:TolB-like protein/DNA-binding winged helix-turn-helix (wHTH) protein/tetratricopeptide (TPR) repeat protein
MSQTEPPRSARTPQELPHTPLASGMYQVGDLCVDTGCCRVTRRGQVVPLTRLSFDLLLALVQASPNVLTPDLMMERVWPGVVISPETVTQRVKVLRDALGDDPRNPRYIEGVRGRGYRLRIAVSQIPTSAAAPSTSISSVELIDVPHSLPTTLRRLRPWSIVILAMVIAAPLVYWLREPRASKQVIIERKAVTVSAAPRGSIAVLPFENLSGDKEQEYFVDGMTDALTTDLAQIGSLRVISRTSAMHYKGSKETLPEIGRDLKVDAVVEGSVARGENRVRVTAQLVEASSDHHLWARTYERDLKDVLALQDEIAQDVADQVRVTLTPKERSLLMQVHTVDPEAYDDYLRGVYWMDQATLEGRNKACDYFQKAIAKDPSYASGYFGVAWCQDAPDKLREILLKALTLDPSLAEAHALLSKMKFDYDWDWPGAEAELKQAIALNPNSALAHSWYSFYLVAMARLDEAMREVERARDLDPYSAWVTFWLGQVLYHARRYDEALRVNQRGLEMHPDNGSYYWGIADIYEQKKMFAEAFAARQRALSLQKYPRVTALDEAYKRGGYKGYLLKQAEFEQTHNALYAAHCYALLNDEPRAVGALEAAYKQHDSHILFIRTAPELDSIRSSPHFRDVVRRIGSPPAPIDKNSIQLKH